MASKTRAKIRARAHKIRACVRARIKARRLETQRLDFFAFPPELRILIYRQLFANSRIYFHPQTGRFEGNRPATFTTTGQWNILLTCKTAYEEGRLVFIQESQLIAHQYGLGGLTALGAAVSDFTAANIPHLRNVGHENGEPSQIQYALTRFPKLKSVGFTITPDCLTGRRLEDDYLCELQGLSLWHYLRNRKVHYNDDTDSYGFDDHHVTERNRRCIFELINNHFSTDLQDLIDKKETNTQFLFGIRIRHHIWVLNLNTKKFCHFDEWAEGFYRFPHLQRYRKSLINTFSEVL
ncbi:hypothetical protein MGN70_000752 [Eutypa lata]|nr:hypothetical protein MGN70_000752 [Eutypa lata]